MKQTQTRTIQNKINEINETKRTEEKKLSKNDNKHRTQRNKVRVSRTNLLTGQM